MKTFLRILAAGVLLELLVAGAVGLVAWSTGLLMESQAYGLLAAEQSSRSACEFQLATIRKSKRKDWR